MRLAACFGKAACALTDTEVLSWALLADVPLPGLHARRSEVEPGWIPNANFKAED